MKRQDYFFELPKEQIAQQPLKDRSSSRLLVLNKETKKCSHTTFSKILEYLEQGDCLVLNDTKVLAARLIGNRIFSSKGMGEQKEGQAKVELLLLKRLEKDLWESLAKPGKKVKTEDVLSFGEGLLTAKVEQVLENGNRLIRFQYEGIFEEILDRLGQMPLPPYITETLEEKERYQTVYAKEEGSAAAPTAGLHFTKELLEQVKQKGVKLAMVTLHVGLGTFRPVKEENILDHVMHSEFCRISEETASLINETKQQGKRVICVGTTTCRTLESCADEEGRLIPGEKDTDIFIYPGYSFRIMDALITNFHLPESTLLMLVSAFAGREAVMEAYREAVKEKYRFFSFGDAMLLL